MFARILSLMLLVAIASTVAAQPKAKRPFEKANEIRVPDFVPVHAPGMAFVALDQRLPMTKLQPAIYVPDLCLYRYRVGTNSPECQKFVDQALGYYYSYVWIEAARSAETALRHDPNCAYAWLVLHKGLEKWGRSGEATTALKKAQDLMPKAPHREQLLITARLNEKGLLGTVTATDDKKKKAAATLDELLIIYDDDEEGWFARAALGGIQGSPSENIPYYKALLKVNPLHPGANHELVHFSEGNKRPALGWQYAEGYIASSPGIPHALHMQAHLAMRIGKWEKTTDRSAKAIELEKAYHKAQGVKPSEDHQFSHHLETLTLSLLHDGRYQEALAIKKESEGYGYKFTQPWFRLALGTRDWDEVEKMLVQQRKTDKTVASYYAALMYLERGDAAKASTEIDVLRQALQMKKTDKRLEMRLNEVQGRYLCQTASGEAGVKLLQRNIDKTKDDYYHHAWGGGAYFMEAWGIGALDGGIADVAEEAFLEALAHDAGSVRAALGMQALCARLGRAEEAKNFGGLANRLWAKAAPKDLEAMRDDMIRRAEKISTGTGAAAGGR